jgi:cupin 2 domain-containing protein
MKPDIRNIHADLPTALTGEQFETLIRSDYVHIERIVSHGQATPEGEWLEQELDEWVLLLSGSAGILFEGETAPRSLTRGDHLLIPARCRHRVEWTAPDCDSIWLAVHFPPTQIP